MEKYRYLESGLDNVIIEGLQVVRDDDGDEVVTIPFIAALHAEIARGIVTRDGQLSGAELRFLRSEMGMTQAELGKFVNVDGQTIGRWERAEFLIDQTAETVLRGLAGERLIEAFAQSVAELVRHVQSAKTEQEIRILAEPGGYSLKTA